MNSNLIKFLSIGLLLITVSSVNASADLQFGNTFFWWAIDISILICIYKCKPMYYNSDNENYIQTLKIYFIWNIICVLRGIFVAENYWEWKNLFGMGMVLLLPVTIYISTNKFIVQYITAIWFKYALPAFVIFLPFLQGDAVGRYLVPISFIVIFFPILDKRWQILSVCICVFVIFSDLSARSNVIKFALPFIFSLIYYVKPLRTKWILNSIRLVLLFLPFLLFILATIGVFNIFKMDEYIGDNYTATTIVDGRVHQESLTADTRSPLYIEVIQSAIKYNYLVFGRTPARGNESASFGMFAIDELKTGKMERYVNEVSILNVFTWTGILGVLLYFMLFFRCTYLSICKSKNIFSKIIGVYLSFRWTYAWVEDFTNFDLSYIFLWIMIGMCFSVSFRNMSDREMRFWSMGIFYKKYRDEYKKALLS